MKKIISVTFLLFYFFVSQGQSDSSSFEKLQINCRNVYLNQTNNYSTNFFEALLIVSRDQLRPGNLLFKLANTELKSVWPGESEETVYYKIADSIYTRISNEYLWGNREISLLWTRNILKIYADKFCACLSGKTIENEKEFASYYAECDKVVTNDFVTVNKIRAELAKVPEKERANIQPLISIYLYKECKKVREFDNETLIAEVKKYLDSYISFLQYDLKDNFLTYYKGGKQDSSYLLFPGFSSFKKDIDFILQFTNNKKESLTITKIDEKDSTAITITETYYVNTKEIKLTGQVVCKIDGKKAFAPIIKSLKFISPDKIENKKELLQKIDEVENLELPPPPIEELRMETPKKQ